MASIMPKRMFARIDFSLCLSLTTLVTAVFAYQFQNAKSFPVGKYPVSAVAADLNKDGKMDLIVANSDQNFVSVLLGNGNGTFQPAIKSKVNGYPYTVAVGDFN